MAWSTPDITLITDAIHDGLDSAIQAEIGGAFTVTVNRASPEVSRKLTPCQLSFYLLHIGRDAYWRNAPVAGPRPQLNVSQPLSLNLYYLLTAWADARYDHEQRVMTVALQYFHANPVYRHLTGGVVDEEFTISVEADTIEEMSRLWQAFAVPMRLSCVIRVGIVFVAPQAPPATFSKPPVTANVAVGPTAAPGDPIALYGAMNIAFAPFPTDPLTETASGGELVGLASRASNDSNVLLRGANLDQPAAGKVYLSNPAGTGEWPLDAGWRQATGDSGLLELFLPDVYLSALPASGSTLSSTPPAGIYRIAVGEDVPARVRSNRVPLVIAARVDGVTGPTAGLFTVSGDGFVPGATRVSIDGVDITGSATVTATSIDFPAPVGPPPGTYAVEIVVNGVPCLPGVVVTL
jgi:hypothetical protein